MVSGYKSTNDICSGIKFSGITNLFQHESKVTFYIGRHCGTGVCPAGDDASRHDAAHDWLGFNQQRTLAAETVRYVALCAGLGGVVVSQGTTLERGQSFGFLPIGKRYGGLGDVACPGWAGTFSTAFGRTLIVSAILSHYAIGILLVLAIRKNAAK
jgi:hypothetical protein